MRKIVATTLAALVALSAYAERLETLTIAGGCFWCVESDFEQIKGVKAAVSGYTGGTLDNPSYKDVTAGGTGHYEAVEVTYDADIISLDALYSAFFRSVDPTDAGGQFCDRGESYRTAIFVTAAQQDEAKAARAAAQNLLGQKIVTPILAAATFYPAEHYHQDYYRKNPVKYKFYRNSCGRDRRVKALWGDNALNH